MKDALTLALALYIDIEMLGKLHIMLLFTVSREKGTDALLT